MDATARSLPHALQVRLQARLRIPRTALVAQALLLLVGAFGAVLFLAVALRSIAATFGVGGTFPGPGLISDAMAWSLPQLIGGLVGLNVRRNRPWVLWGAGAVAAALVFQSLFMAVTPDRLAVETGLVVAAEVLLLTPASRHWLRGGRRGSDSRRARV
ncbi:hypothetical protein BIV57_15010 [Mangrovactinospora gilvigrisea]|uniref:Uncharacterized protein n=1 Tax=Mangrovactinospora gilvigrisea TaxID=1428644 RepID=A0A1J7CAJ2_9ACTN|nr:hypothetical protein [Mangrovactinospora gilvigrisea]OIV36674.1 hypothetical protein BIV57_15010 [Mangrovactinospora gilvigrisea]